MALGYRVIALDLHLQGLQALHQVRPNATLLQGEAACLPLKANAFGAAILLDLIEHVDDRGVLGEIQRVLRPGGMALITVPALPWLWSYRDDVSGHLRRYTRSRLYKVIKDSRLEVCEIRHYQFILLPLVILTRLLGRESAEMCNLEERPLPVINSALTWINQIEAILGDFIPWPCGSSLVAVCRKA